MTSDVSRMYQLCFVAQQFADVVHVLDIVSSRCDRNDLA